MKPTHLTVPVLALLSGLAPAQSLLHTVPGPVANDYAGSSVAGIGDINNDGRDDFAVGLPNDGAIGFGSGRVRVYSGANGGLLMDLLGANPGDAFGTSVAGCGDVNGDGRPDFIVGAPSALNGALRPGMARVYSGLTGAVLHTFWGDSNGDSFGYAVAGGFDADQDGYADLLVGAPNDDNTGSSSGSVRAFSGRTGAIFTTFNGANASDNFGWSIAIAGDVSNDGSLDFVVGAPNALHLGQRPGEARVLDGLSGAILGDFFGNQPGEQFGYSVAGGIDVELDGFDDLVIGAPYDDFAGNDAGSVSVFNGLDGELYNTYYGAAINDRLGYAVACLGDIDNDGHGDMAFGSAPANLSAAGYVQVRSGSTGLVFYTLEGDAAFDQFGCAVANAHDVNNDGIDDLVIGARYAENGLLQNAGQARVHSGKWLPAVNYCTAKVNSQGCTPSIYTTTGGGPSYSNTNIGFAILADHVINQRSGILIYGVQKAATPFLGGTLCIAAPVTRTPLRNSGGSTIGVDCTGTLAIDFNTVIQSYVDPRLTPGRTVYCQWWYRDGASVGGAGLSNATSFAVAP